MLLSQNVGSFSSSQDVRYIGGRIKAERLIPLIFGHLHLPLVCSYITAVPSIRS
jgi:hypothetical protein